MRAGYTAGRLGLCLALDCGGFVSGGELTDGIGVGKSWQMLPFFVFSPVS